MFVSSLSYSLLFMVPAACALFPQRWYLSHYFPLLRGTSGAFFLLALVCLSQQKHNGHPPFNLRQRLSVHAGASGSRRACASPALCWEQWDPQPHGQLFAPQNWEWWMPGMGGGS